MKYCEGFIFETNIFYYFFVIFLDEFNQRATSKLLHL